MIELFQITGSASFAARAALEEGGIDYTVHDVHPVRRDSPAFAEVNPLRLVPAIRDGGTSVYETGAVLLYLVERFPEADLGPLAGNPARADLLRWVVYLSNTVHHIHAPVQWPAFVAQDEAAHEAVVATGLEKLAAVGDYLETQLADRRWLVGDAFSVADIYLYMLKGWESYGSPPLGGEAVDAHFSRVGARPAIARARQLDDLDERLLRHNPTLRGGVPIDE